MFKRKIRALAFAFLVLSWGPLVHAQGVFTIDIPGATFTRVIGLNAQGDVCGGTQLAAFGLPSPDPGGRTSPT